MIGIINYGMGNIRSVKNALDFIGAENCIISEKSDFDKCDKLLLPGVGAFAKGMENLRDKGFIDILSEQVLNLSKPILGICLGMQLLLDSSTEHGNTKGLGFIKGEVKSLAELVSELSLPHMGWNDIKVQNDSRLLKDLSDSNLYFVHNYYCSLQELEIVTGIVKYGLDFHVAFEKENIFACQFHPEKSHESGLQILKNFEAL